MPTRTDLASTVRDTVQREYDKHFSETPIAVNDSQVWASVHATGTRLWLDTGDMDAAAALWNTSFEALTTNNTLLNKEVQKGIYDSCVQRAVESLRKSDPSIEQRRLIQEIAFVLNALHGLRLVNKFGAHVSVELHTDLAHTVEGAVEYGRRFHELCPERFYVKVPLTPDGLLGARKLGRLGIPVNLTLGFSARQNYVAAVVARPAFVNVFMGRLNGFLAYNELGSGVNVGEKTTLATQREILHMRRGQRSATRLIGASMRNAGQVKDLLGLDVFTMPTKVAEGYVQSPEQNPSSQTARDPDVPLADGVALGDFYGTSLWEVSGRLKEIVDGFSEGELDTMHGEDLVNRLHEGGCGDLLPRWTSSDVATASGDGKIPVHATWKERLVSREIGLDALMNLSALESFVSDQKQLDDRTATFL